MYQKTCNFVNEESDLLQIVMTDFSKKLPLVMENLMTQCSPSYSADGCHQHMRSSALLSSSCFFPSIYHFIPSFVD